MTYEKCFLRIKYTETDRNEFRVSGSGPGVRKRVASCRRRTRPAREVSAPADRTSPDRRTCRKSVCLTRRPCPSTRPNTIRLTTVTTTRTRIPAIRSPSARPRNRNPKPPTPEATSKAPTRTWTTSVSVTFINNNAFATTI